QRSCSTCSTCSLLPRSLALWSLGCSASRRLASISKRSARLQLGLRPRTSGPRSRLCRELLRVACSTASRTILGELLNSFFGYHFSEGWVLSSSSRKFRGIHPRSRWFSVWLTAFDLAATCRAVRQHAS